MRTADLLCFAVVICSALGGRGAAAVEAVPMGTYVWRESDPSFGGFSGLVMVPGGASFHAVSDQGELYAGAVTRDPDNRIAAVRATWHGRLLDNHGRPVEGFTSDAEALAPARDGGLHVAFESYARVTGLRPPDLHPEPLHDFDRFKAFWNNESFEGLAERPDGALVAVLEKADEAQGGYPTVLGTGRGHTMMWRPGPVIPAGEGGFAASDAAFGPDGQFYLLERRLSLGGFASRIRRFTHRGGVFGSPETVLETAPGTLGNMEGMSLWTDAAGRTVISLISDDNFLLVQKTVLAEYELREGP